MVPVAKPMSFSPPSIPRPRSVAEDTACAAALRVAPPPVPVPSGGVRLFLFFSNRLGCLGSLLVSAVLTVVLLLILGVL
jgi:hypothetical protein